MLAPLCNFAALGTASFGGDARLLLWTLAWDNHALLDRVPGFFDANIFHPAPNALAYSEHVFGISLFSLPIYAATRNPVLAYNGVWILSYFLTAVTTHLLAWRYTRDHLASTVAGLAAAFCFYRMHQGYGHLHIIWAFWIPISFLLLERWVKRRSWPMLAALTAVVVAQALASWYQAVIIAVADGAFFVWLVGTDREARQHVSRLLAQGLAGMMVALAAVWPFARHYDVLTSGGPADAAAGSADLLSFLVPPENTFLGQWLVARGSRAPRWIWGEQTVYLGSITLALATAGAMVAVSRRDGETRQLQFFVVLGLLAAALALGPAASEVAQQAWGWTPFGVLMHLPKIDLFRVPARFVVLVTLAVAVLAAAACARLHTRLGRSGRLITICLIPLVLGEFYVVNLPGGAPTPFKIPAVYKFLATEPRGAVVSLPDYADTPLWFQETDYQYFSTAHWLPIANGYSRAAPPGFRALMDSLTRFPSADAARAARAAGIRYVILHAGAYGEKGPALVQAARESADYTLKSHAEDIYLFELVDPR
jgi:hypothetical protein